MCGVDDACYVDDIDRVACLDDEHDVDGKNDVDVRTVAYWWKGWRRRGWCMLCSRRSKNLNLAAVLAEKPVAGAFGIKWKAPDQCEGAWTKSPSSSPICGETGYLVTTSSLRATRSNRERATAWLWPIMTGQVHLYTRNCAPVDEPPNVCSYGTRRSNHGWAWPMVNPFEPMVNHFEGCWTSVGLMFCQFGGCLEPTLFGTSQGLCWADWLNKNNSTYFNRSLIKSEAPEPSDFFRLKFWAPGTQMIHKCSLQLLRIKGYTNRSAQGGGGSFKNRKPIGEIGCCESRMAEQIHWWTERWLEQCFLEWLQWLQWSPGRPPHPQLLDVVWCSAAVVVVVVVV